MHSSAQAIAICPSTAVYEPDIGITCRVRLNLSGDQTMVIAPASSEREMSMVRGLFLEYAASLPFDLDFQGFDEELRHLPGEYSPPSGCLLLATSDGHAAGCVALRLLQPGIGEMKRLFVRPQFRGLGLGNQIVRAILEAARPLYSRVRLDTTPTMTKAVSLYESLGFRKIEAYRHNPVEGAVYLEIDLTSTDLPRS